jgi:hypothetical protein
VEVADDGAAYADGLLPDQRRGQNVAPLARASATCGSAFHAHGSQCTRLSPLTMPAVRLAAEGAAAAAVPACGCAVLRFGHTLER